MRYSIISVSANSRPHGMRNLMAAAGERLQAYGDALLLRSFRTSLIGVLRLFVKASEHLLDYADGRRALAGLWRRAVNAFISNAAKRSFMVIR